MTKNKTMLKIKPFTGKGFDGRGRSWEEVDAIVKKMQQPNYHQKSKGLVWNATPTDKAKYEICQSILWYVHENKLSEQDLKKILGIKGKKKLECLLFTHIDTFSLDELGEYSIRLFGSFNLKILRPGEEIHKTNGRLRKHL